MDMHGIGNGVYWKPLCDMFWLCRHGQALMSLLEMFVAQTSDIRYISAWHANMRQEVFVKLLNYLEVSFGLVRSLITESGAQCSGRYYTCRLWYWLAYQLLPL